MGKKDSWTRLYQEMGVAKQASQFDFVSSFLTGAQEEQERNDQLIKAAVESRIGGTEMGGAHYNSVRNLTDAGRRDNGIHLPVPAGTRVAFVLDAESAMSYAEPPPPNAEGLVVSVKTARDGVVTSYDGKVYVKLAATGKVMAIFAQHLREVRGSTRKAKAPGNKIRIASLGDLTGFLKLGNDTLVHKATQDLWKLSKDSGGFVIERLFQDNGTPVKA